MKLLFYLLILVTIITTTKCNLPPNIVFILADDMGWNDVGHHGSSQIPTPNIDALGFNGVLFNKYYTMHVCTPSRSALLTGKYPIRTGMQGFPLRSGEPRHLPFDVPTLAEKLSELGYSTHLVGKWHLGHQFRNVTPLSRGFDTHLGYWNGFCGYHDYEIQENPLAANGFDLHRGYIPAYEYAHQIYATDLFTSEAINIINNQNKSAPMFLYISHLAPHTGKNGFLEVKNETLVNEKYNYIESPGRRKYADIVEGLDESIGKVVAALQENDMLNNTIIIFKSDNGAQTIGLYQNFGSNWPLRGLKFTLFEGGVRNTAVMWSKSLKNKKYVENSLFHVVDWFPTLYAAAGGDVSTLGNLDGINQWPLLSTGIKTTSRPDLLLNIDEKENHSGILSGDGRFKLVQGTFSGGIYDAHYGDSGRHSNDPEYNISAILNSPVNKAILKADADASPLTEEEILSLRSQFEIKAFNYDSERLLMCNEFNGYCLFDLVEDPNELEDVKSKYPDVYASLKDSLSKYKAELMPQTNKPVERPISDPFNCNGTWFPWRESDPQFRCITK